MKARWLRLLLVGWVMAFGLVTASMSQVRVIGTLCNFDVIAPPFPPVNDFHIRIWYTTPGPPPQLGGVFVNPMFMPPQVIYGPGYIDIYYPPGGMIVPPGGMQHFGVHLRGNPLGRRVRWACWWTWNGQPVFPQPPWRPGRPWQGWVPWGRPPRMIDVIWWRPEPEAGDVPRPIWVQRRVMRAPIPIALEQLRRESPFWQAAMPIDPTPVMLQPEQELEYIDSFFDVFAPPGMPETLILSYEIFEDMGGFPGEPIGLQMNAVVVEQEPEVHVQGHVDLAYWLPPSDRYPVRMELRPLSGDIPEVHTVNLTPLGDFDVVTQIRTPMNVWVKGVHWLAMRIDNYDPIAPTTPLVFRLPNGDITNDNRVDLDDFLVLASAYETEPGHPAWNEMADLDGSLRVDLDDFLILAAVYETHGMP